MSTKPNKTPEPVIPVDEVKKDDTKGEKRGSGKTNKGPHAVPEKDDRKNLSLKKRVTPNAKRTEGTYIRKDAPKEGDATTAPEEEQKNDGQQKKQRKPKYERVSNYNWDRSLITLETPLPIKPTQKELVKEARTEEIIDFVNKIEVKIEAARALRDKKFNEIINKGKSEKTEANTKRDPLITQLKELFELQKVARANHDVALAELKVQQETLESLKKKVAELSGKMKKPMGADQIREEIEELSRIQMNERLTSQQEKKIVSQIDELKQALPFAAPLQKIQDEMNEQYKITKKLKEKQGLAYKNMKEFSNKIDEIQKTLDELKKLKEESTVNSNPELEKIKFEFQETLADLRKQRDDARKKFDEDRKTYEDQQELIRYADFVKKQHDHLRKIEMYKKKDEERAKREEEEKALEEQKKKSKYVVFVEIAEMLITYLEKVSGKGDKKDFVDTNEVEEKVVEQNLSPEELEKLLKKEKLTVLVSKKDLGDRSKDFSKKGKGSKQHTQQSKQAEKPAEPVIDVINHSYDIMQQFEKLSVPAPTYKTEVQKTIDLLNEKKQYYVDLPNKEATAGTSTEEGTAAGNEKHDKKTKKQAKIEFDETAFPEIGGN